jgi:uncharacterized membrane protein
MSKATKSIILIVFILNFIVKCSYLTYFDIALDEPFTIFNSQKTISEVWQILINENNPPLHFLFLHFWMKLFGMSALAVRIPSVLFSSFAAVMVFLIGKRFFNLRVGIFATALFTFSTMHVFFSHEARVYPLFVLLTACSIFEFLSIYEENKTSHFILLLIFNSLLIYAHYFGFFVLISEAICFLIFFNEKKKYLSRFLGYLLFQVLIYLPVLHIFITRASSSLASGTWVAAPHASELYGNINRFLNDRMVTAVLILVVISLLIQLFYQLKSHFVNHLMSNMSKQQYMIITMFLLPYLIMFLLSYQSPMFIDRYILFTTIPLYLTIAIIISNLSFNTSFFAFACVLILAVQLFFLNLKPDNNRRLKEVASSIKSKIKSSDQFTMRITS